VPSGKHANEGMMIGGIIVTSLAAASIIASIPVFAVGNHQASQDPAGGSAVRSAGAPLILVGLAAAVVGIQLWVSGAKDPSVAPVTPDAAPPPPAPAAAKAIPVITAGLGSASLRWKF
jgi:hypothetical protein